MDLQYVYNKSKNIQQDAYRIVLRNEKPTLDEERSLKKHGINGVIIVENFEKFYPDFVSMYQYLERENREKIYKYINKYPCVAVFFKKCFHTAISLSYSDISSHFS